MLERIGYWMLTAATGIFILFVGYGMSLDKQPDWHERCSQRAWLDLTLGC